MQISQGMVRVVPASGHPGDIKHQRREISRNRIVPATMTWARRLKRVFHIDITECEKCQGPVKIIACIEDPVVIAKILAHLGSRQEPQPSRPPPSRGPPLLPGRDQEWSA